MKTFQVTYQPTRLYASEDVAHWLGVRHADLMRSFEAMYQTWPEVGDCGVTDTTAKPKQGGQPFSSLLIPGAALAAFLYWRSCRGKPEAIFSALRTFSEGEEQ